jgi:chromosome partitioning protein
MTQVISVFNQSGGVGKTTLTMNLGYHLAAGHSKKVLLVDLDPQASLTVFLGQDPFSLTKSIYDSVVTDEPLPISPIKFSTISLDLVPSTLALSAAEMQLVSADAREQRLKEALEPVREGYDFILIDCPPSLGILSILSLVASTHILIPIQTQFKAFQGTDLLFRTIARIRQRLNKKIKIAGYVPTYFASGNKQDVRMLEGMKQQFANTEGAVFPAIPRTTAFADASEARLPLALHDKRNGAVKILESLASSLEDL